MKFSKTEKQQLERQLAYLVAADERTYAAAEESGRIAELSRQLGL